MLTRFNSNPDSSTVSSILGGNIDGHRGIIESIASDSGSDLDSEDDEQCDSAYDNDTASEDEVKRADKILFNVFGLNLISLLIKMILKGTILSDDFVVQCVAYKCQSIVRGKSGIRYLRSWGMFWAGCRNIIKSRGLIPFSDHFCIPAKSQLVKFKSDIMRLCGLDKDKLGKPGLQSSVLELWMNSKVKENPGKYIAVSANMDAKRIAVTPGEDGEENMGEVGMLQTIKATTSDEIIDMVNLLKDGSRASLFSLYDSLSSIGQDVTSRIHAIKLLEETNTKRLEKNPMLAKYLHVLKSQLAVGNELIDSLNIIQCYMIQLISNLRKAVHLLPSSVSNRLKEQPNYQALKAVSNEADKTNLFLIEKHTKNEHLLEIQWDKLKSQIGKASNRIIMSCLILTSRYFIIICLLGAGVYKR